MKTSLRNVTKTALYFLGSIYPFQKGDKDCKVIFSAFLNSIWSFSLAICLFLFVNESVKGQWEALLGEEGENWGFVRGEPTTDGGFVMVVKIENFDIRVVRVNALGEVVLNLPFFEFDIPEGALNSYLLFLRDGSYLAKYYLSINNTLTPNWAKLNPFGKLIWTQEINENIYGRFFEEESGEYLSVSNIESGGIGEGSNIDILLEKVDGNDGHILWTKTYGGSMSERIKDVKPNSDGSYSIAGSRNNDAFVVRFSTEGDSIGGLTYPIEDGGSYFEAFITMDGGLLIEHQASNNFYGPLVLEKIDALGNREWKNQYVDEEGEECCTFAFLSRYRTKQVSNGSFLTYADYQLEWYRRSTFIEILPNGEILSINGHNFEYEYLENINWLCEGGSILTNLQESTDKEYWLSGYSIFYENFDSEYCNHIPFIAKMDLSGEVLSEEFYDLGDPHGFSFNPRIAKMNERQAYFLVSAVTNNSTQDRFIYIVKQGGEEGKSATNLISGQIFLDRNHNCQQDEADTNWHNDITVRILTPETTRYAFVNQNGQFSAQLPIGNYTITYTLDNELIESHCEENQYTINFTEDYDTVSNVNFAFSALLDCPKLEVEIGTPLLRRCFKNIYKVKYCNKGTLAAENAQLTLEFPDGMIPLESSIAALEEGNQWTFDLGTVDVGECGFFMVQDSISCEAELGSTLCLKSRIVPDDSCEVPNVLWDRSNIDVKGKCIGEQVRFTLENIGSGNMNEERNFYVYKNNVLTETRKIQLNSNERQQLYLNPNGKSLKLKVEQSPYFPIDEDQPQATVESCGSGNFSFGYVNSTEQNDRHPSVDIDCQIIVGSFDPNDIQVSPTGTTDLHFIEETTKLTYKIRFQNTGSDTAFRVMIIDTLPKELDGATLNLGNSSHDYTFDIKFGNLLVWTFDNILLPDSTINERESHGFVQFSISPKVGLALETKIENKADIYFDFNEPVSTNQVFNTITDDLGIDLGEPLGVNLMGMDIKLIEGNKVQLNWWTLAESNSSHFEVERSNNAAHFEVIETVKAKGDHEGLQPYQMIDSNIKGENLWYYRLKIVDIDGSFEYSKAVSIRLNNNLLTYRIANFNGRKILLDWMGSIEKNYTIRVYNTLGQTILTKKINDFQTSLPSLNSGVYFLQIFDNHGKRIKTKKIFGS